MRYLTLLFFIGTFFVSCGSDENEEENPQESLELITPKEGITQIKFGDTAQKVFDTYGVVPDSFGGTGGVFQHFLIYGNEGLIFYLEDSGFEELNLNLEVIRIVCNANFKAETPEGIKVGSTRNEVISTYGEPDKISTFFGEDYDTLGLNFEYNDANELVTQITIER